MHVDFKNINQQLIVAGMSGLIKEDGYAPNEVSILLDMIKKETWSALKEIHQEVKNGTNCNRS